MAIAIESFPYAIVPDPLLRWLRSLAKRAELDVPFVDELAADILWGGFTAKLVRAAAIAARGLEGTLHARYQALPVGEVLAMDASPGASPPPPGLLARAVAALSGTEAAAGPVAEFGALAARMAGLEQGARGSFATNGRIIEQQQILTTQNVVPLIDAAGLAPDRFGELAWRALEWLAGRVQRRMPCRIDQLRTAKNAAYAWRQATALLSLAPAGATDRFLADARRHLSARPGRSRERLTPIPDELESAHRGRAPRVRLVGWATGAHPLVDDQRG